MAAYYLLGNDAFISESDLDGDMEELIFAKVFSEFMQRGLSLDDALASLQRVSKRLEETDDEEF